MPLVSIFGAKAAPAYTIAKDIIHALLTLSKVIAADPEVSKWLQVVFVEITTSLLPKSSSLPVTCPSRSALPPRRLRHRQYEVHAERCADAGHHDGANVEISQQVGEENIYIFGQTSDQVIHRYAVGDYDPAQWVEAMPTSAGPSASSPAGDAGCRPCRKPDPPAQ